MPHVLPHFINEVYKTLGGRLQRRKRTAHRDSLFTNFLKEPSLAVTIPVSTNGPSPKAFSIALLPNCMACSIFISALYSLCSTSRECLLPYDIVHTADSTDKILLAFLRNSGCGKWNRNLEC